MNKPAETRYPIHPLIAERWSPVCFANRPLNNEELGSLFEAARWAASSYNEQPWRFLIATQDDRDAFQRLADCLVEGNSWAKDAPVLVLSVANMEYARNGKANAHAWHDVGLATGSLITQAQSMGLSAHQMGGFDRDQARAKLNIPANCEPIAMMAIGYATDPANKDESLQARDEAPRQRKSLEEIAFAAAWKQPFDFS